MIGTRTFAAIDFESAGAQRGKTDVPVQIGMATWSPENGYDNFFDSYLASEQSVSWAARKVHGITDAMLEDAPSLISLWPKIKKTLSARAICAHGHGTEKRYLRAFPGHNFSPWLDTLLLSRAAWPELPSHSLGNLCEHFSLTKKVSALVSNKSWHDALYDATACLVLLEFIITKFDLAEKSLDILLYPDISQWHASRR